MRSASGAMVIDSDTGFLPVALTLIVCVPPSTATATPKMPGSTTCPSRCTTRPGMLASALTVSMLRRGSSIAACFAA